MRRLWNATALSFAFTLFGCLIGLGGARQGAASTAILSVVSVQPDMIQHQLPDGSILDTVRLLGEDYALWDWSPDGRWILLSMATTSPRLRLYKMRPNGDGLQALSPGRGNARYGAWSPDGEWILYESNITGNWHLYMMRADGSTRRQLTEGSLNGQYPSWSADGEWIVFAAPDSIGRWEIYRMRPDGSELRLLSQDSTPSPDQGQAPPRWSPDGREVVYSVNTGFGNLEVFGVGVHDTNFRRLTNAPGFDMNPHWSPDGSVIAYSSDQDGQFAVYAMSPDGGEITRLVDTVGDDYVDSFSPDGRYLLTLRMNFPGGRRREFRLHDLQNSSSWRVTANPSIAAGSALWSPIVDSEWRPWILLSAGMSILGSLMVTPKVWKHLPTYGTIRNG